MASAGSSSRVTWRELAPSNVPIARSSHGVSVVGDTMYVFGGENVARTPIDSAIHALDLSDPSASFITITTENAPPPRVGHSQASIANCIYIFGGRQGVEIGEAPLNDLWAFDTTTKTWKDLSGGDNTPCPRSFHVMTSAKDTLYVFGGCGSEGRLADLHSYDTTTGTWMTCKTSGDIEGRGGAGFSSTSDGTTLVVAGGFAGREMRDVHKYDIASKTWCMLRTTESEAEGALRPRSVWPMVATSGFGDHVIGFGGEVNPSERGHDGAGGFANDVIVVDSKTGAATTIKTTGSKTPAPRGWTSAALWKSANSIVLFGGLSGSDSEPERLQDVHVGVLE